MCNCIIAWSIFCYYIKEYKLNWLLVVSFRYWNILEFVFLQHCLFMLSNKWWWLKYRVSKFVVLMYLLYLAVSCISIKSHQSNQTCSTTWRTSKSCKYSSYFIPFYNLQYMYMYNLSRLRTIFAEYSNSTTK